MAGCSRPHTGSSPALAPPRMRRCACQDSARAWIARPDCERTLPTTAGTAPGEWQHGAPLKPNCSAWPFDLVREGVQAGMQKITAPLAMTKHRTKRAASRKLCQARHLNYIEGLRPAATHNQHALPLRTLIIVHIARTTSCNPGGLECKRSSQAAEDIVFSCRNVIRIHFQG